MIGAFIIGLIGSLHCVGMCGPLMITFTNQSGVKAYFSFVLYHGARILIYGLIGLLFGILGTSLELMEFQRVGAIVIGILIIVIYGFPKIRNRLEGWYYQSAFYQTIKNRFTGLYNTQTRWLAAGVVNGFLPCGLIYLAAAGAIMSGSIGTSFFYMLLFGLGTLPALVLLATINVHIPGVFKKFPNLISWIAILSGGIMIIRGVITSDPDWNQLMTQQINHLVSACGL